MSGDIYDFESGSVNNSRSRIERHFTTSGGSHTLIAFPDVTDLLTRTGMQINGAADNCPGHIA